MNRKDPLHLPLLGQQRSGVVLLSLDPSSHRPSPQEVPWRY